MNKIDLPSFSQYFGYFGSPDWNKSSSSPPPTTFRYRLLILSEATTNSRPLGDQRGSRSLPAWNVWREKIPFARLRIQMLVACDGKSTRSKASRPSSGDNTIVSYCPRSPITLDRLPLRSYHVS